MNKYLMELEFLNAIKDVDPKMGMMMVGTNPTSPTLKYKNSRISACLEENIICIASESQKAENYFHLYCVDIDDHFAEKVIEYCRRQNEDVSV
jgi:hypothetical protein